MGAPFAHGRHAGAHGQHAGAAQEKAPSAVPGGPAWAAGLCSVHGSPAGVCEPVELSCLNCSMHCAAAMRTEPDAGAQRQVIQPVICAMVSLALTLANPIIASPARRRPAPRAGGSGAPGAAGGRRRAPRPGRAAPARGAPGGGRRRAERLCGERGRARRTRGRAAPGERAGAMRRTPAGSRHSLWSAWLWQVSMATSFSECDRLHGVSALQCAAAASPGFWGMPRVALM